MVLEVPASCDLGGVSRFCSGLAQGIPHRSAPALEHSCGAQRFSPVGFLHGIGALHRRAITSTRSDRTPLRRGTAGAGAALLASDTLSKCAAGKFLVFGTARRYGPRSWAGGPSLLLFWPSLHYRFGRIGWRVGLPAHRRSGQLVSPRRSPGSLPTGRRRNSGELYDFPHVPRLARKRRAPEPFACAFMTRVEVLSPGLSALQFSHRATETQR